ncbi:MAG: hypothetical protein HN341_15930, partial [Verrucomicrobia bacterium]|nr:hypothetical protein [Verrucomicrobiota bacterium]
DNMIEWIGEGTIGTYDISLIYPDATPDYSVHTDVPGPSINWVVPANAIPNGDVVSNVIIRVRDHRTPGIYGDSDMFTLVIEPLIIIDEPKKDAFLKVGEDLDIEWIKGGQLSAGDFRVFFEYGPGFTLIDEIDDLPTVYDEDENLFKRPWGLNGVPDDLGEARILVTNTVNSSVFDTSEVFYIAPNFEVVWPNGTPGEDPIFANQPVNVSWLTWGSVDRVNLFYSTNSGPWVLIASDVPNNSSVPPNARAISTYRWEVPTLSSGEVKFRVQDAAYGTTSTYDGVTAGPYDDSDDFFGLNYFTVLWHILYYDEESAANRYLDQLSVTDSSGWSQSGLPEENEAGQDIVPIERQYPYGTYDTVWYRQFFNDAIDFQWVCDSNQTRTIVMQSSDTEPDAHVLADFVYSPGTNELTIHSWIERGGRVLHNPDSTTVIIYDTTGSEVRTLTSSTVLADGFFRIIWPDVAVPEGSSPQPGRLERGETYLARVEVVFNGVTFSAAVTYTLSLAPEYQQITDLANQIDDLEDTVTNQVGDLQRTTEDFRDEAIGRLRGISNQVESVDSGITNIAQQIDAFSNTVMTSQALMTNSLIGVLEPAVSNILATVSNVSDNIGADQVRILNRPTTVTLGSTNTILFKTSRGLGVTAVQIRVEGEDLPTMYMDEMGANLGIYSYDLVADWGVGSYTITCTGPQTAPETADSIVIEVAAEGADALIALADELAGIEGGIAALGSVISSGETDGPTGPGSILSPMIVNRPMRVALGSENVILFKSTAGQDYGDVKLVVLEDLNLPELATGVNAASLWTTQAVVTVTNMTEVAQSNGLYAVEGLAADWGVGSYTIICGTYTNDAADEMDSVEELFYFDSVVMEVVAGGEAEAYTEAAKAAVAAQGAKTAANAAGSAAKKIKDVLEGSGGLGGGGGSGTDAKLDSIQNALDAVNANIAGIPAAVGASALHQQIQDVAKRVSEIASREGYSLPDQGAGPGGGASADDEKVEALNENLSEVKISLEFMQKILDEKMNEPVVQVDWIGVE